MSELEYVPETVILVKHNKMLIWCECDVIMTCPQGKTGGATRCRVWVDKSHISKKGIEATRAMNKVAR